MGGFGSFLLGSAGGPEKDYKNQWKQLLGEFNAQDYNPQMDTAQTMESYDQQIGNQIASGQSDLGQAGFGGTPLLAGTRARFGAMAGRDARQRYADWRMKKLSGMGSLLGGAQGVFTKAPTQGMASSIGSIMSGAGDMGFKPFGK